mmetsp:Transcript_17340/g.26840  ORF Transcript_17340/g.26840 Transcript_17340/m.26840 type:complete len:81 (+) Transcript_17340:242-484(+)
MSRTGTVVEKETTVGVVEKMVEKDAAPTEFVTNYPGQSILFGQCRIINYTIPSLRIFQALLPLPFRRPRLGDQLKPRASN